MSKVISIYNKETKIVVQTMSIRYESEIYIDDKHAWIEGYYIPEQYKVIDGVAQSYTRPYEAGTNEVIIRQRRNELLENSDWTQVPDSPLTDAKKAEWVTYRQQLRDMMSSYTDSESNTIQNITFPTPPS